MKKPILIAIVTLFVLVVIVGMVFYFGQKSSEIVREKREQQTQERTEAQKQQELLQKVSTQKALRFWFFQDQLYYMTETGQVYLVDSETGQNNLISPKSIENITTIIPSKNGEGVMVMYYDGTEQLVRMYTTKSNDWQNLPTNIHYAALSPGGTAVIQLRKHFDGSYFLELFSLIENELKEVAHVAFQDSALDWQTGFPTLSNSAPSKDSATSVFMVETDIGNLSPLALEKNGFMLLWSPMGNKALAYWVDSINNDGRTALIDARGTILKQFQNVFLPIKCTFADEVRILCGVPKTGSLASLSDMPDSYFMQTKRTNDRVVSINTQSGKISALQNIKNTVDLDIYKPQLINTLLYFINRNDGHIYLLQIEQQENE